MNPWVLTQPDNQMLARVSYRPTRGHQFLLGKGTFSVCSSRRGKGRTQLSLLPRALHRPSTTGAQAENGPALKPAVTTSEATEAPKMSNADFAKLLLRK